MPPAGAGFGPAGAAVGHLRAALRMGVADTILAQAVVLGAAVFLDGVPITDIAF